MFYRLLDYYENPFGEVVLSSKSQKEIYEKVKEYRADTDGECDLVIEEVYNS